MQDVIDALQVILATCSLSHRQTLDEASCVTKDESIEPATVASRRGPMLWAAVAVASIAAVCLTVSPPNRLGVSSSPANPEPSPVTSIRPDPPLPENGLVLVDSAGSRMRLIPAGTFNMGISEAELRELMAVFPGESSRDRFQAAMPGHEVAITKPFYLGEHEVTVGEFRRFVEATDYRTTVETNGKGGLGRDVGASRIRQNIQYTWRNTGWVQGESYPVVNVSWFDAVAFCNWKSQVEKIRYRLPSEAEWEYACAGLGDPRRSRPGRIHKLGNIADLSINMSQGIKVSGQNDDGFTYTAPVGSFTPNHYGLLDMVGNVWEWCGDWYGPYTSVAAVDPQGPPSGSQRVARGGSWNSRPGTANVFCRSGSSEPEVASYGLGFRVVRETSGSEKP